MMYVAVAPNGLTGFDWIWIALGVFADFASYAGSAYGNQDELMVDAA
jgi:hypothetical protein